MYYITIESPYIYLFFLKNFWCGSQTTSSNYNWDFGQLFVNLQLRLHQQFCKIFYVKMSTQYVVFVTNKLFVFSFTIRKYVISVARFLKILLFAWCVVPWFAWEKIVAEKILLATKLTRMVRYFLTELFWWRILSFQEKFRQRG